jgi:DNA polymerase-3 subunit epsilon
MLEGLKKALWRRRLRKPEYAFLLDGDPGDEVVSIDCETTGLDVKRAQILSIGAIKVKGEAILTSERLDFFVRPQGPISEETILVHHIRPVDLTDAVPLETAIDRVLRFVGPRPLIGYYLQFDVGMLEKHIKPMLGVGLPNRKIEVSALYYDWRAKQVPPGGNIDLRFETIRQRLKLPRRAQHDAFNDALLTAMMYLRLTGGWQPRKET